MRPTEAGFLAGLDIDTIVSLVCAGELHIGDFSGRGTFICLMSLCLLNQNGHQRHEHDPFEYTRLSPGREDEAFPINTLKKL